MLSLNGKGKVQVTKYVRTPLRSAEPTPPSTRAASPELIDEQGRIGPPILKPVGREERERRMESVLKERREQDRFFLNVGGYNLEYLPPKSEGLEVAGQEDGDGDGEEGKKARKGRKQGRNKGKKRTDREDGEAEAGGESKAGPQTAGQTAVQAAELPDLDLTVRSNPFSFLVLPSLTSILRISLRKKRGWECQLSQ